jgi:hypothetical protein
MAHRRNQRRHCHLLRAVQDRSGQRFIPFAQIAMCIFNLDGGIVNKDAYREGQSAKRRHIGICIAFVPVTLLSGAAKFIFTPLALAVVFAMIVSYLLSRTIVATMMHYLLPTEVSFYQNGPPSRQAAVLSGAVIKGSTIISRSFSRGTAGC